MSESKRSSSNSESSSRYSSGVSFGSWFPSWVGVPSWDSLSSWVSVPSWVPWGTQETKEQGKYRDDLVSGEAKERFLDEEDKEEKEEKDDSFSDEEEVSVNVTMTSIGTIIMKFHCDTTKEEMRKQIAKKYFPPDASVYLSRPSGSIWPFERAGDVADGDIFALTRAPKL